LVPGCSYHGGGGWEGRELLWALAESVWILLVGCELEASATLFVIVGWADWGTDGGGGNVVIPEFSLEVLLIAIAINFV